MELDPNHAIVSMHDFEGSEDSSILDLAAWRLGQYFKDRDHCRRHRGGYLRIGNFSNDEIVRGSYPDRYGRGRQMDADPRSRSRRSDDLRVARPK